MRAERALDVPEHPLPYLEGRDAAADRLDLSGELGPEEPPFWLQPDQAGEKPQDEGLRRPVAAVGPIHRCCIDLDEHLVLARFRLVHFHDPNDLG